MSRSSHDGGTKRYNLLRQWQRRFFSRSGLTIKQIRRNRAVVIQSADGHRQEQATSLLQACAIHDRGGGVSLTDDVFAIYSTAVLPSFWQKILQRESDSISPLRQAASTVAATSPIYTAWESLPANGLVSLPCPPAQKDTLVQKPWFLINAAISREHCIIGQGSVVETLLVVLRRPWCVLEICCSSNSVTIAAVLDFALLARMFDPTGYDTAVYLLTHEFRRRTFTGHGIWVAGESYRSRASVADLRDVCSAVFVPSTRSYNSFWICLICVCAVELALPLSTIVRAMTDDISATTRIDRELSTGPSPAERHFKDIRNQVRPRRDSRQGPYLARSWSAVDIIRTMRPLDDTHDSTTDLVAVYSEVLMKLTDMAA